MNPRERRTVLIALAVLVPSLGWVFGVKPLRAALAEMNDRIAIERDALSRERAAILQANLSPARKQFADSAIAAADARVFSGANEVAAGGTLVTYLGDVARRTHVWLASASTRANTTAGGRAGVNRAFAAPAGAGGPGAGRGSTPTQSLPQGMQALRVELRAESDFQGVLEFLDALERGNKVVTIERLDIARVLRAGDEDRETLSITATVVGYSVVKAEAGPEALAGSVSAARGGAP